MRTMESPLSATSSGQSSEDERRGSGVQVPCHHVPQPAARASNYPEFLSLLKVMNEATILF